MLKFEEKDHKYTVAGERKLCVSDILRLYGLSNFSFVDNETLTLAQDFGIATHKVCEYEDKQILDRATIHPNLRPYHKAWQKYKSDKGISIPDMADIEVPLYSKAWNFCGTPDRILFECTKLTLVDIKTVSVISKSSALSTAAYQLLWEENNKKKIKQRKNIQLLANGKYKEVILKDRNDVNVFKSMLSILFWKINNGYLKQEDLFEVKEEEIETMEITQENKTKVNESLLVVEKHDNYKIENTQQLIVADEHIAELNIHIKIMKEAKEKIYRPAKNAVEAINDFFNPPIKKAVDTKDGIRLIAKRYIQQEEEKRLELERKLQEQARKEEERKKKALEERAKKAEEKGNAEKAEELREKKEEVFVVAPVLQKPDVNIDKRQVRVLCRAKVVDFALLPDEWKMADMVALNNRARTSKGEANIPGVVMEGY